MGGSPSSASGGDWSAPDQSLTALQGTYLQGATQRAMEPFIYQMNPTTLQQMGNNLATTNAVNSMQLEKNLTPQTAAMRQALPAQLNAALTGNDPMAATLEKYATTAGLKNSLDSGMGTNSSMGQAQIMNVLGQGVMNRYNQNQSNAASYLAGNPLPSTGIDPGSLLSMYAQNQGQVANAYNGAMSNVTGLQGGSLQNAFGQLQQDKQRTAGIASNDATSANQYAASQNAMMGQMVGAGIGAVGSMAGGAMMSSEKVKDNIVPFTEGYDVVKKLNVKKYTYKQGYGDPTRECIGLIAEETPEPTRIRRADGIDMVDLYCLLSTAISAIKTIQTKVEALEAKWA